MTETCEACRAVPAPGNTFTSLSTFRGHNICPGCCRNWRNKDKALGREATWEEFLNGSPTSSSKRQEAKKARDEHIVKLAKEGKTTREIALLFGLSERMIQRILTECWR